ncbi:MAG: isopenicillin N synthase family oxygenase, partial [Xanthomonadales bacterium]|nr:isopenicillin N synthase family oxygenase [Xanthomonadales bacterium]
MSSDRKAPDRSQGIGAVNQEFSRFEQVRKDQRYRLSEHPAEDQYDEDYRIPVCDMAAWFSGNDAQREAFTCALGDALRGIGFAILTGHGVDQECYNDANRAVLDMFGQTTREQRMAYLARRHGSVNQGYFPMRETTIIHPDLVEGWVFCRRAFDLDGSPDYRESDFWPLPGFEPRFRKLVQAQQALVLPIMQSLLQYLGCDPYLYDEKLAASNFGFRLNYYPPLDPEDRASGGGRMLGHEDVDLFTLLPTPDVEGLQVLNRENMKWIRLDAPPGSIILNTGDYMQRISNDIFPSTT